MSAIDAPLELDDETLEELGLSLEEAQTIVTPNVIGLSWAKGEDGGWLLPERTLGWQIAGWCAEYLQAKGGGPWRFTPEQLRFVLWWYAVDGDGNFVYSTGVLQRLKGWGKDPLLAVLSLVEMVGPSRVKRTPLGSPVFDGEGHPVGVPHPQAWVQIAAVNQSQTRNTVTAITPLLTPNFVSTYGFSPGAELMRAHEGRQRIEAVTSSPRALEGGRPTFVVLNETHHWLGNNGGHDMFEVIDRNATKTGGRYLCITNAYLPGEDSVAQRIREEYEAVVEGKAEYTGLYYDSLEAHPKAPLSGPLLPEVVKRIRGDASWLDPAGVMRSIRRKSIAPSVSRRMWLNQIVADEESLHSPATWDVLEVDTALVPGDEIVLGFDGSKSSDATALVAIRVSDKVAFLLHLQECPDGPESEGWEVDRVAVDSAVHEAFQTYEVQAFFSDVAYWESYISDWGEAYAGQLLVKASERDPVGFDMRRSPERNTRAHESLMQSIFDGKLHHDGDLRLRRHVLNARRRVNNYGLSFGKESKASSRKVDAYAALMLAHAALDKLRIRQSTAKPESGNQGWFF